VAFRLAARRPEVVERLVVMNGPHPQVLARELLAQPPPARTLAYIALFVVPWLPERLLAARRGALVGRLVRPPPTAGDLASRPPRRLRRVDGPAGRRGGGARLLPGRGATAPTHRPRRRLAADHLPDARRLGHARPVPRPELVAADRLAPVFAPGVEPVVVRVEAAGHFVQHEAEPEVNAALLAFLSTVAPADRR
jgi:pimeloyl-ACP methyl ester carboxylesterase